MAPYVFTKRDASGQGHTEAAAVSQPQTSTIAIAGFSFAGALLLLVFIWIIVLFFRRRARARREERKAAAFLTVKGIVKDVPSEKLPLPAEFMAFGTNDSSAFSRANLTASVVMPDKAFINPSATREDIIAHHAAQGTLPRPFAPFSFALSASGSFSSRLKPTHDTPEDCDGSADLRPHDPLHSPAPSMHHAKPSGSSVLSAMRDSVLGSVGHRASGISQTTSSASSRLSALYTARAVRQLFTPILPDELVLALGERVTLAQSFDDGWCIVGRARIGGGGGANGDVEFGAVPAWCFVRPMKGLRSERPVRSSSLGVTLSLEADGPAAREDIISWSNF